MHFLAGLQRHLFIHKQWANLLTHALCRRRTTPWTIQNKQTYVLTHLVILVGSNCYEVSFGENVSPERAVRKFQNVVCSHNVKPRLILVHGVQNRLRQETMLGFKDRSRHFHFTHTTHNTLSSHCLQINISVLHIEVYYFKIFMRMGMHIYNIKPKVSTSLFK